MPKVVIENTLIRCTKGIAPMPLKVTGQNVSKINGSLIATEVDKVPFINIPCFGTCMQGIPLPCVPSPIEWNNTSKVMKINGIKCITQESSIQCAMGGKISIILIPHSLLEVK